MTGLSISVALCTFNGERFLRAQLDSIAAQDRPPNEVVVCDDGSSDGTAHIVREFASRIPFPCRLVVNEINLRSTKNFEQAISLCRGSIIALADQDDVWYPNKLSRMEKIFLRSDSIVAAFSDADLIDANSRMLNLRLWHTLSFNSAKQKQFAAGEAMKVLIRHPVVTGAAMAFRREFIDFLAPIPPQEIHDRWISFLLAARGRFAIIPEALMQYRRHDGQQIGPGPVTLPEQMLQVRQRGADFYFRDIERFHQLSKRLEERNADFPNVQITQKEITNKLSHLEHRARLSHTKAARLPKVLQEIFNGNYWRYSGGWKSVAKDIVIR